MKTCPGCGQQLPDDAVFCTECGASLDKTEGAAVPTVSVSAIEASYTETPAETEASQQPQPFASLPSDSVITLAADGKYRWVYEMPKIKNLSTLFMVWKILGIGMLAPLVYTIVLAISQKSPLADFLKSAKVLLIAAAALLVLSVIVYILMCALKGWKTVVIFEMDDRGIIHARQENGIKKSDAANTVKALTDLAAGISTSAGAGILAGTRSIQKSRFSKAKVVKANSKKNVIKITEAFSKNQVYVESRDFEFVWSYITSRCKRAKIK